MASPRRTAYTSGVFEPARHGRDFLTWWGGQLRDLLPARGVGRTAAGVLLEVAADRSVRATARGGAPGRFAADAAGRTALRDWLGRLPPGLPPGTRTVVAVAPALALQRDVPLPLAAERHLRTTLELALAELTPFRADEVLWDAEVIARHTGSGRLTARLRLVVRSTLDPVLQVAREAGCAATSVVLAMPEGNRALPLAEPAPPGRGALAPAALCAALVCLAVAIPFARQAVRLHRLDARIAALQPRLAQAEAGRRGINTSPAARNNALRAIAAVTNVLPDGTWLTEFGLRGDQLQLTGQSSDAARLIPAIAAAPDLADPAFSAPVTRGPNGTGELFGINAHLRVASHGARP